MLTINGFEFETKQNNKGEVDLYFKGQLVANLKVVKSSFDNELVLFIDGVNQGLSMNLHFPKM